MHCPRAWTAHPRRENACQTWKLSLATPASRQVALLEALVNVFYSRQKALGRNALHKNVNTSTGQAIHAATELALQLEVVWCGILGEKILFCRGFPCTATFTANALLSRQHRQ